MNTPLSQRLLNGAGALWFIVALAGQGAFIVFILAYYGTRTLRGDFAAWNDKPLIDGYIAGDGLGNFMFILHVLGAAVITTCGLLQLIPALRRAAPGFHRWSGRLFIVGSYLMATGGLMLVWARGTQLALIGAVATSLNAVLILVAATMAWVLAAQRRIEDHRLWAMRTFMLVNGVWFLRVGIMGWAILSRGAGMNNTLSGPADIVLIFGSYLIPLAVLELYFWGQRSQRTAVHIGSLGMLVVAILFIAIGIVGAQLIMWGPNL